MPDSRSLPYRLLLAASAAWLAAVVAAPLLRAAGLPMGELLHFAFSGVCHQLAERSYWIAGHPLAVCARCWGLYCGFALGVAILPAAASAARLLLSHPRLLIVFFLPLLIDVFLVQNTHFSRFLTGLLAAAPLPVFVWEAIRDLNERLSVTKARRAQ